jgi:hypothetical protein
MGAQRDSRAIGALLPAAKGEQPVAGETEDLIHCPAIIYSAVSAEILWTPMMPCLRSRWLAVDALRSNDGDVYLHCPEYLLDEDGHAEGHCRPQRDGYAAEGQGGLSKSRPVPKEIDAELAPSALPEPTIGRTRGDLT